VRRGSGDHPAVRAGRHALLQAALTADSG
jgi:hypothetical protein